MIEGTTLIRLDGATYYSPQFRRQGNAAVFALDLTSVYHTPSLEFRVEHREETETSWATAGIISPITATGVHTLDVSGLKEILRFMYRFISTDPEDAVRFSGPSASWRPY